MVRVRSISSLSTKEVGGSFNCSHNQLTSLEYAPKEIGGDFNCNDNPFTNDTYNELEPSQVLDYLQKEKLQEKIITETPKLQELQNNKPVRRMKL